MIRGLEWWPWRVREKYEREARERLYARTPAIVNEAARKRSDLERLLVLAGRSEEDPLWKTVLSYADEHERNELDFALKPGMTDADRQFAAGRASGARDFAMALRDLKAESDRTAHREKAR